MTSITVPNSEPISLDLGQTVAIAGLKITSETSSEFDKNINENILLSVSDFASETAPINPIVGQQWYRPSIRRTFRFNGSNWVLDVENNITNSYEIFAIYDVPATRIITLPTTKYSLTITNVVVYDEMYSEIGFSINIDNNSIVIKGENIPTLVYVYVFETTDEILNHKKNKSKTVTPFSGQHSFDILDLGIEDNINRFTVVLNGTTLSPALYDIVGTTIKINSNIVIKATDTVHIRKYGSGSVFEAQAVILNDMVCDSFKILKTFSGHKIPEIRDVIRDQTVQPITITENNHFLEFEMLSPSIYSIILPITL